ncbi:PREDICTED: uncharacterized protein LOC104603523 [Nelumbo nucifera]|uniref:Uncharacterized protein LOC104603523 n=1 Tax=Nelumbo nucifera TaxID=4432 RepID=A0A1U8AJ00_NELNU|nr:PREDICTED: uncharacterized protein LOC104603523 [Nelumbo nucifera]
MAVPSHPKSIQHPCPSSNSMKIKTLFHSHVFRHICLVVRALTKAKSVIAELFKDDDRPDYYKNSIKKSKKKRKLFSTIRTHYNWCSSHVIPMPEPAMDGFSSGHNLYYDSTWNSVCPAEECEAAVESQLSGHFHWLEEKVVVPAAENSTADVEVDEIDRLAAKFIASCHEKFRLEKQESYRRYQEMMARSV